jgi:DNA replication and repair protein RecF
MSLVGPHRDDLQFFVSGVDMNLYASRGQRRTIALALKLGEARHFLAKGGEEPLLLLDDVLSELDASRQAYLLDSIPDQQQAFLTTTHLETCPPQFLRRAAVFQVSQGCIVLYPPPP